MDVFQMYQKYIFFNYLIKTRLTILINVGMTGKKQSLSLKIGDAATGTCLTKDTVAHEFIHALGKIIIIKIHKRFFINILNKGFDHEQARPDRDFYVEYHPENLENCNLKKIIFSRNVKMA